MPHWRAGHASMNRTRRQLFLLAVVSFLAGPTSAQWLHYPTPGTPRTRDGLPNLSAPAPRTRDGDAHLSRIWRASTGKYLGILAADGFMVPFQPWAQALYQQRLDNNSKGRL